MGRRAARGRKQETTTTLERYRGTFFGRDADLDAVASRIAEGARLVTLLGPGGVGKTRLAQRLLARLAPRFDAALFCDLSTATTSVEISGEIASCLGGIALGALRKLGLKGLLVRGERGWLLDPRTPFA